MDNYSGSPGQRAAAYWFVDGLPEIVSGFIMALSGGIGLALMSAGMPPWPGFLGLFLLFKERSIAEFLKARLTYPRTGYAKPPMNSDELMPARLVTLMPTPAPASEQNVTHFRNNTLAPLILGAIYTALSDSSWIWPLSVWAAVAAMYVLNRKLERPYRWWEVVPLALAGSALVLTDQPRNIRPASALVLAGVWLVVLGGNKLARYLKLHPRPAQQGAPV